LTLLYRSNEVQENNRTEAEGIAELGFVSDFWARKG
jgi:hypothetical protein